MGYRQLSVLILKLRDKHGAVILLAESTLRTASGFNDWGNAGASSLQNHVLPFSVNLPASDVVQEGELSVHQAGQESDLPVRTCRN